MPTCAGDPMLPDAGCPGDDVTSLDYLHQAYPCPALLPEDETYSMLGEDFGQMHLDLTNMDVADQCTESWQHRSPQNWTRNDVTAWYYHVAQRQKVPLEQLHTDKFARLTGHDLLSKSKEEFLKLQPREQAGELFYSVLQKSKAYAQFTRPDYEPEYTTLDNSSYEYTSDMASLTNFASDPQAVVAGGTDQAYYQVENVLYPYQCTDKFEDLDDPYTAKQQFLVNNNYQTTDYHQSTRLLQHSSSSVSSMEDGDSFQQYYAQYSPETSPEPLSSPMEDVFFQSATYHQHQQQQQQQSYPGQAGQYPRPAPRARRACSRRKHTPSSGYESDSSGGCAPRTPPGRRPGSVSRSDNLLWKFLLDLLRDEKHNGTLIRWENREEGVFKILQSKEVAQLWGQRKSRKKAMNYEKLSRALRDRQKEDGFLTKLPKGHRYAKKLVFKFGPCAKVW